MNQAIKIFLQRDRVVKAMSSDGFFRVAVLKNTRTVLSAQERHLLSPLTAVLLGRMMSAATLLSSFLKGEERIIVEAMGNGIVGKVFAEALQVGEVRGYVEHPSAMLDFSDPNINLSSALGIGLLRVTRVLYNQSEPAVGIVELKEGDINTDLAYYLTQSEQIPSAVALDVDVDSEGKVCSSGGLLIQALPGAPAEEILKIQQNIIDIGSITNLFTNGYNPDEVLKMIMPFELTDSKSSSVEFFCRCSLSKFKAALKTLDTEEILSMQKAGHNELVCQYCHNQYILTDADFEELTKSKT